MDSGIVLYAVKISIIHRETKTLFHIVLLLALIFITSPGKQTMPVAVSYLITGDVFRWGLIMAGAVSAAVPVIVLYYLGQRFVVQGLATGAVKG